MSGNTPIVNSIPNPMAPGNMNATNTATTNTTTLANTATSANTPMSIQPGKGPFTVVGQHFPMQNPTMEATRIQDMYQYLFQTPNLTPDHHTQIISTQPSPLPMLAICKPANTLVMLHGIGYFYPTLSLSPGNHFAAGSTLVLLGDALNIGCNPLW